MIEGNVFNDPTNAPLAGWSVQIIGAVNAIAQTDANGYYSFMNLPAGTYQVCEVTQSGWTQVFPTPDFGAPCPLGGLGWSFSLSGSVLASFVDFRNVSVLP